jgi:hypothetical protein
MQIDGCLDRGGAFDYAKESCETAPNGPQAFPVVAYDIRHGRFYTGTLGFGAVLGLLGFATSRFRAHDDAMTDHG